MHVAWPLYKKYGHAFEVGLFYSCFSIDKILASFHVGCFDCLQLEEHTYKLAVDGILYTDCPNKHLWMFGVFKCESVFERWSFGNDKEAGDVDKS